MTILNDYLFPTSDIFVLLLHRAEYKKCGAKIKLRIGNTFDIYYSPHVLDTVYRLYARPCPHNLGTPSLHCATHASAHAPPCLDGLAHLGTLWHTLAHIILYVF